MKASVKQTKGSARKPAVTRTGIKPADYVAALARGLEILRLFSFSRPSLTTSDASELTGLSRASARRFLLTLTELGYLRNDSEVFSPEPRILELGYAYLSTWNFPELVTPSLRNVVDTLCENCSLAILSDLDVVYIARVEARRIVQSITISVGTRVPAPISALGRVLLADLDDVTLAKMLRQYGELRAATPRTITDPTLFQDKLRIVRENGYALVDGEFEEGLISIAVPVRGPNGKTLAAINVGAPDSRVTRDDMIERYLPVLRKAADDISRMIEISGRMPPPISALIGSLR